MASLLIKQASSLLIISFLISSAIARPLEPLPVSLQELGTNHGLVECWEALSELRACSNEIILFLMNGEMYLGKGCCRGIRIITRHCWPSMLASIGFTAEQGDVLRGYCDATEYEAPPPMVPGMWAP
ncbi:hypothetical protein AMTRI_Chr09g35820 [Amborella trichopoda]